MNPKAAVITFPGSNCDDDLVYALGKISGFDVESIWHKDHTSLKNYQLVALPGGFSYGDYLRTGAMAAHSPILDQVKEYAENSSGLLLGVCNGFQILCEAGLLPGALARNESLGFVCRDVELKVCETETPWSSAMKKGESVVFPIAHGEGRYVISETEYEQMKKNGQILFEYVNNPNGSCHNVAGVCNAKKNVMGLMPHPERATHLRSGDGKKLWQSIRQSIVTGIGGGHEA